MKNVFLKCTSSFYAEEFRLDVYVEFFTLKKFYLQCTSSLNAEEFREQLKLKRCDLFTKYLQVKILLDTRKCLRAHFALELYIVSICVNFFAWSLPRFFP